MVLVVVLVVLVVLLLLLLVVCTAPAAAVLRRVRVCFHDTSCCDNYYMENLVATNGLTTTSRSSMHFTSVSAGVSAVAFK